MTYAVRFAPEAADQLESLYRYIAGAATAEAATRYVEAIVARCEGLAALPHAGMTRDDIRPGPRIVNYRKRVVIAFFVDDDTEQVSILGIFYGGQDFETDLGDRD